MFMHRVLTLSAVVGVIANAEAAAAAPHEKGRGSDYDECTSPSECSLNGCVVDSHCVCDTGWVGSQCGVLDLAPATISSSYIPPDGVSSSWGMSVVKETLAATPTYHGYVSEFLFKCNLDSWGSNSYVNHVVSPTYVDVFGLTHAHARGLSLFPVSLFFFFFGCSALQRTLTSDLELRTIPHGSYIHRVYAAQPARGHVQSLALQ